MLVYQTKDILIEFIVWFVLGLLCAVLLLKNLEFQFEVNYILLHIFKVITNAAALYALSNK